MATTATDTKNTTNPLATNTASNVSKSAADKARSTLAGDFDTFLLLLTTQLKNQDPIEPMDTNEFTSQLVQFATVEQAIQSNTNLEKLIDLQKGSTVNSAAQYMGRFIQATGDQGNLSDGVATFSYTLPSKATTAEVSITDSKGAVVFTGSGPTNVGLNDVIWDGTNSFTGATMADGIYKLAVVAKDADGNKITATTYTTGFVTGVNLEGETPMLRIGQLDVAIEKVKAIRDASDFAVASGQ